MKKKIIIFGGSSFIAKEVSKFLAYKYDIVSFSQKSVKIKKILEYMISLSNQNIEIVSENASQKNQDMNIYFGDNKKLIQLIGDFKFIPWKKTIRKMMF